MRIVAIKDMSAGNDTVGEMWRETKLFNADEPLSEVMKWAGTRRVNVTLTVPENDGEELYELTGLV